MPKRTIKPSSAKASIRAAASIPTILEILSDGRIVVRCTACAEPFTVANISDVLSGHATVCDACLNRERA
jgi:hypothetical protein